MDSVFEVPPGIRSDKLRVELDTKRVAGWNEIDAVELIGSDGTRQWATESTASSYYGESRTSGLAAQGVSTSLIESSNSGRLLELREYNGDLMEGTIRK